jgi:hypothetical protein
MLYLYRIRIQMSTSQTIITKNGTVHSTQNRHLTGLIELYNTGGSQLRERVPYDLFKLVSIAYLKENNEVVGTLVTNEEFRDELFNFVEDIYKSDTLRPLVNQYSSEACDTRSTNTINIAFDT